MIQDILNTISAGVIGGGTLFAAWQGVSLGLAIKDHAGPEIRNSIMGVAGAAIIIAVGALIKTVSFAVVPAGG